MLTKKQLELLPPGTVFRVGVCINEPNDLYMTNDNLDKELLWVAKRGQIHDWAIYVHWKERGQEFVTQMGDKLQNKELIQKLVSCDEEALALYRY
jgi:hypothetical protein